MREQSQSQIMDLEITSVPFSSQRCLVWRTKFSQARYCCRACIVCVFLIFTYIRLICRDQTNYLNYPREVVSGDKGAFITLAMTEKFKESDPILPTIMIGYSLELTQTLF